MDVQQVHREAVARVQARRLRQGPMRAGESIVPAGGEFKRAETPGEWWDDRLARTPPRLGTWVELAYKIAAADRIEAAAAQVAAARSLGPWNQWYLFNCLQEWRQAGPPVQAATVLRAAIAEWDTRGLVKDEPIDEPMGDYDPDKREPKRPTVRYRKPWGHPAGVAV